MHWPDSERGVIRNREAAKRLRDFSGLKFGSITPTDIDGFMDFGNKLFIFIESKTGNAGPPTGQRLALERLVDATQNAGISSFLLLCQHGNGDEDVDVGSSNVSRYRYLQEWRSPQQPICVRDAIDRIRTMFK